MLGSISTAQSELGDLVRFRLGPRTTHVVCHPAGAQEVLVDKKENFLKQSQANPTDSIAVMLGNGLFTSHGRYWQRQRRMMQPLFHRKSIIEMGDKITAAGSRLLQRWATDNVQHVDITHEMARVTLDVISRTMFDAEVDHRATSIETALDVASRYVFDRIRNPLMLPPAWPTRRNREFKRALGTIDDVVGTMIEQRRGNIDEHDDLLTMLLLATDDESGAKMDARQLRDEIATIFAAGHETTAAGLAWTCLLMAQHPQVAAAVRDEVNSLLGTRPPGAQDYEQLPLTQAVFQESMRLYPPGPLIVRSPRSEDTVMGYSVPAGSVVLVSVYNIHRNPEFWDAPAQFNPQRFMGDVHHPRHVYFPFGLGQRMCIGSHLALMEGVLLIAQLVQHFNLTRTDNTPVEHITAVTLRPKGAVMMDVQPRSNRPE